MRAVGLRERFLIGIFIHDEEIAQLILIARNQTNSDNRRNRIHEITIGVGSEWLNNLPKSHTAIEQQH